MKHLQLLFILSLLSCSVLATHNRSGEILYKRVAPFGTNNSPIYTYSITVIKYTDHGSLIADRCVDTVYFGDGQKGIASRINGGTSLNCGCSGTIQCGQLIVQQNGYIVKKSIYSILHTYPGAGTYTISSSDPNRNAGIHNIPNSVNVPFRLESMLVIHNLGQAHNSPQFMADPINQATLGLCFYDNMIATDADGDSLSYELIPCAAPGYFYPEIPLTGTLSMDALSGTFTWCYPTLIAEYQVAYLVKEWRKNLSGSYVLIGSVIRDRQILVKPGPIGVEEMQSETAFSFFPNPASSRLFINAVHSDSHVFDFQLFDAQGNLQTNSVEQIEKGTWSLDLKDLTNGIYFLRVNLGNQSVSKKIIIE